ncbi:recombination-associated protein RdgC [Salinicola sp. JS01]|uniref:recombination-associated protein RdgC n=1 Tax=Salinicola sp. JS01 TaxID=3050071 RepID=UPI00255B5C9C|nr:recombination-associated protein RdgC [Salinicola sp. JS01]WIX32549.1 recombination-associated protein RdgC [Salinicola sp. JS01]
MHLRNSATYRASLPDAKTLEESLTERLPYRDLHDSELTRLCFVPNARTGELVTSFDNGYSITMRVDERVIPAKVRQARFEEEIEAFEKRSGRYPSPEEKAGIRERILGELCKSALVDYHTVNAYYHPASELLFVDTASKKDADRVMRALVMACDTVKTQTIHVNSLTKGLTAKLIDHIENGTAEYRPFGQLGIDDTVKMAHATGGEGTERVTYQSVDVGSNREVLKQLHRGFEVEDLGLVYRSVYFRLTKDFKLKSITWDILIEPDEESAGEDEAHAWRVNAMVGISLLVEIVNELCALVDFELPALPEAPSKDGDEATGQSGEAETHTPTP